MSTSKKKPSEKHTAIDYFIVTVGWISVAGVIALMIWVYLQMGGK